jgi:phosphatidylglycerol---prolipoprotein diacylglyceryl transferase
VTAILLTITIPFSPVALQLGPLAIRWYGIAYAVAFLVGGKLALAHTRRRGIPDPLTNSIIFWAIVCGLVGARLYFVVQSGLWWYLNHPAHILAFWEGGMAYFGAIFAVLAVLLVASRRLGVNFWILLGAGVLFAAAGQPIGRLGNIMNGEILGPPSSVPWAFVYTNPQSMAPHLGVAYQPAAAYEGLAALAILACLLLLRRRGVPDGVLGISYLVLYCISQLIVFCWRTDYETPVIWLGLRQAQLTAIAVLLLVVPPVIYFWWRSTRRGSRATPLPDQSLRGWR